MDTHDEILKQRRFLQAAGWEERQQQTTRTDQQLGVPEPPAQKAYPPNSTIIELPLPESTGLGTMPVISALGNRESRRKYTGGAIRLDQLSFLLWATQGVRKTVVADGITKYRRLSPSAGARHPFESYLAVERVDGLTSGLYRYLHLEHRLLSLRPEHGLAEQFGRAACQQVWMRDAAVVFVWTAIPYRTEWRYARTSHKVIALDAGHLCQNLYLACEALGLGTCAVAAYVQDQVDQLLEVDGADEFTIYLAPVGRID